LSQHLRGKLLSNVLPEPGAMTTLTMSRTICNFNGKGNFVGAYTVIGNDAVVGDYNMIQAYTVIGHDARLGCWNRIDTHVTCVGGTVVEDEVNIHTSAVISHKVVVETGAHVGALSFVIRRVKAGTTVMGNPAKKLI
jgi:acetyltransferase-like isoleucine patch superfamily enzyme